MSHALALVADDETTTRPEPSPGITVPATITVDAGLQGLSFSSSNPLVQVAGTDITLQPDSSTVQPVTYDLLFVAGSGISSFQTPAVEILLNGIKAAYTLDPSSDGASFTLSFVNNLPKGDPSISLSFFISWNSTFAELLKSEDPTILLDPPKS
jgi:hypothetical protein